MPELKINASRLNSSLKELGSIGDTPEGMQRIAFSPADVAGREYVISRMRRAGLETKIDTAGNIIGRRAGSAPHLPAIVMGSHTDTVPSGGKYDGALGVLAAVECVQTLADTDSALRHPVEVTIFTNEEGTRFHRWLIGSRAMAGLMEAEDMNAVDNEGVHLSSRMADVGGDLSRIEEAARKPGDLAAYLELHIEQGPTLEQAKTPIGVVTGITGRALFEVEVKGTANHAGTTPMPARHDALVSASKLVLAVERVARELETCRVATVGSIRAHPNAVNVVPGSVSLGLEFRDLSMDALSGAERDLRQAAAAIADSDGVEMEIQRHRFNQSAPITTRMQDLVEEAANRTGLAHVRLPSGAGHDAQAIAAVTDMAMIFVPSVNGISHSPEEYSTPQDCANGAQVLLELLLLADQRM